MDAHGGMPSKTGSVDHRGDAAVEYAGAQPTHYIVECEPNETLVGEGWHREKKVVGCLYEDRRLGVRLTAGAAETIAKDHAKTGHNAVVTACIGKPPKEPEYVSAFTVDARFAEAVASLAPKASEGVRFEGGVVVKASPAAVRALRYGGPLPTAPEAPKYHGPAPNDWGDLIVNHLKELGLGVPKDKVLTDYKYRRLCYELAHGEERGGFVRIRLEGGDLVENTGRLRNGEARLLTYMRKAGWTVEGAKGGN